MNLLAKAVNKQVYNEIPGLDEQWPRLDAGWKWFL